MKTVETGGSKYLISIVGAALMGFFGAEIGRRSGVGSFAIAAYSLGVLLLVSPALAVLNSRVRRIEQKLERQVLKGADGS